MYDGIPVEECENNIKGHICDSETDVMKKEDEDSSNIKKGAELHEKLNCLLCEFSSDAKRELC